MQHKISHKNKNPIKYRVFIMEITGLEPAAYALRTHRYPSLAISPYKLIVAH